MIKFKLYLVIFIFLCSIKSGFSFSVKNVRDKRDIGPSKAELTTLCKADENLTELVPRNMYRTTTVPVRRLLILDCKIPTGTTLLGIAGNIQINRIEQLVIRVKEFTYLDENFFNGLNILTKLELENVGIENMWTVVSEKFPKLLMLKLLNNKLTSIPKLNLPKLQEFHIYDNEIRSLDSETFENMPELRTVIMKSPILSSISEDSFTIQNSLVTKLYFINENKHMKFINKNVLKNLNHLRNVAIRTGLIEIDKDFFKDKNSIEYIDLSKNDLHEIPVDLFSTLNKLEELHLSHNNLEQLDESIFNKNVMLKTIDLSNNQIIELPPSIFNPCINLEEINLNNNKLQKITFNMEHLELRNVNLGNNLLVLNNNECLFSNDQYELELILSNNKIEDLGLLKCLIEKHISEIDLSGNQIEKILKSDFDVAISTDDFNLNLINLNLKNNNIREIEFWDSQILVNDDMKNSIIISIDGNSMFCQNRKFLQNDDLQIKFELTNPTCLDT